MNKIIGLKELRENTKTYMADIKKGLSFIVVKKSKPIFKISPVDDLTDDSLWEDVIDFTKIKKNGVSLSLILKSLKKLQNE